MSPDSPRSRTLWLAGLTVALVLVCLPRFDRHDWGFIDRFTTDGRPAAEHLADAAHYVDMVRFFRGEVGLEALRAPFAYRPLVPLIAAGLPLAPLTAIDLVNVAFLVLGLWALWAVLGAHLAPSTGLGAGALHGRVAGGLLYTVAFGPFYYGAVGYVDGAMVGLLAVGSWLILSGRTSAAVAFIALTPFAKEQALSLLPVLAVHQLRPGPPAAGTPRSRDGSFTLAATLAATLLAAGAFWLSRRLFVVDADFAWSAGVLAYRGNLQAEEVLKYLLGFGAPGALLLFALWRRGAAGIRARWTVLAPFAAGAAATLAFALYGRLCCPAGGRLSWLTTPFLIPLALLLLAEDERPR